MAISFNNISIGSGVGLTITPPPPPPVYLWSWGQPNGGRLGLGDTSVRSSPTQIGSLGTWASIRSTGGGGMAQAIKTDGTLWSWGYNGYGQLGLGNTTDRSSPVQIGALTTWSMAVGGLHSVAAKTDGTMWTWGYNNHGQLGLGNTTSVSSPVQIGALTTWSYVHASSSVFSLAIKTDGTLWAWGRNHLGYLGLGDTTSRSSPVQVGALTNWLTVSSAYYSAYATKSDGTMWSWGNNYNGRLGLGDSGGATNRSSPVQIGALTTWSKVSGGRNGGSAAIKTDGTLWSWGNNANGTLGLGDTTSRSSPVQIGALTSWLDIAAGNYHMAAVKTDGTLWIWGSNDYGCLGLGDTTRRSSPVQVGSLTNWLTVSAGYNTIFATSN